MSLLKGRILSLSALMAVGLATTSALAQELQCQEIQAGAFDVPGLTIKAAENVPEGPDSPVGHCRIHGEIERRTGVDGVSYAIGFELRLPNDWNGDFVHQ